MAIGDPGRWEFKLESAASDKELPIPPERPEAEAMGFTAGSLPLPEYASSPGDVHGRIEYRTAFTFTYAFGLAISNQGNFNDLKFDYDIWIEKIFIEVDNHWKSSTSGNTGDISTETYVLNSQDFLSAAFLTANLADATWVAATIEEAGKIAQITNRFYVPDAPFAGGVNAGGWQARQFFDFTPSGFYLPKSRALRIVSKYTANNSAGVGTRQTSKTIVYYRIFKMG